MARRNLRGIVVFIPLLIAALACNAPTGNQINSEMQTATVLAQTIVAQVPADQVNATPTSTPQTGVQPSATVALPAQPTATVPAGPTPITPTATTACNYNGQFQADI